MVLFFVLIAIGVPIAFVLAISSTIYIILSDLPLLLIAQRTFVAMDSFVIIAIPLFILTGSLMNSGGLTRRLVRFLHILFGHIRGSLAIINVVISMVFAGITGSAAADTAAIGGILIPAMIEEGYTPEDSAAVTAASSTIGPIIPPSIPLVIVGSISGLSVGYLLLSGIIPGILIGLGQIALVIYFAKKKKWRATPTKYSLNEIVKGCFDATFALISPLIIIGGILTGIFTPTEAAVIAVFYSFLCGFFIFKEIKLSDLPRILAETAIASGSVVIVCGFAGILGWIITYNQIPKLISETILGITTNPVIVILLINIILLFAGCFMDYITNIIIFFPLFFPTILKIGMNPYHFSMIFIFNLVIGLITPPVGTCLYIASGIAKIDLLKLSIAILPYIIVSFVVLVFIYLFPSLSLFIPSLVF